ncbi:MAG TPA: GH25 family lysozyme [Polyangia bacterium]|nr:GH25 family lysozyme [Polyangia bacterium]
MTDWVPGVDISNWQNLTPQGARALKDSGVELVIVRMSHERPALVDIALRQMQMVVDAGMRLHGYPWAYFNEDPVATAQKWIGLYDSMPIEHVWPDCEETQYVGDPAHNIDWLQMALATLKQQWPTGIYTGRWWWVPRMGNSTAFADEPLWDADYTNVPELHPASLYGGWTQRAIHQYTGNGALAGMAPLDLDAVDPALLEEAEDMGQIEDLTTRLGYLQGDVANALQNALEGAVVAKNKDERQAAYDAIQAAIDTLKNT